MTNPNTNDGGSAFPRPEARLPENPLPLFFGGNEGAPGMSLRAWLAGQALTGLAVDQLGNTKAGWQGEVAWAACSLADAMIAELAKELPALATGGVISKETARRIGER